MVKSGKTESKSPRKSHGKESRAMNEHLSTSESAYYLSGQQNANLDSSIRLDEVMNGPEGRDTKIAKRGGFGGGGGGGGHNNNHNGIHSASMRQSPSLNNSNSKVRSSMAASMSTSSHSQSNHRRQISSLSEYQSTPISKHYALNLQILMAFDSLYEQKLYKVAYAIGIQFVEVALLEIPKHGYFYSSRHTQERQQHALQAMRVAQQLQSILQTSELYQQATPEELDRVTKLNQLAHEQTKSIPSSQSIGGGGIPPSPNPSAQQQYEEDRVKLEQELSSTYFETSFCGDLSEILAVCPSHTMPANNNNNNNTAPTPPQRSSYERHHDEWTTLAPPASSSHTPQTPSRQQRRMSSSSLHRIEESSTDQPRIPIRSSQRDDHHDLHYSLDRDGYVVLDTPKRDIDDDDDDAASAASDYHHAYLQPDEYSVASHDCGPTVLSRGGTSDLQRALWLSGLGGPVEPSGPPAPRNSYVAYTDNTYQQTNQLNESASRSFSSVGSHHHHREDTTITSQPQPQQQQPQQQEQPPPQQQPQQRVPKRKSQSAIDIATLQHCYHEDFELLRNHGRVRVSRVDTYQGRLPGSINGCTVIAPLLCIHHFHNNQTLDHSSSRLSDSQNDLFPVCVCDYGLPDEGIREIIDVETPAILPEVRSNLGLTKDALIIPSDVHDYLIERQLLCQEQFVTVCGGNILHDAHVDEFVNMFQTMNGPGTKLEGKKLAATLFFHEHVVAILKLNRQEYTTNPRGYQSPERSSSRRRLQQPDNNQSFRRDNSRRGREQMEINSHDNENNNKTPTAWYDWIDSLPKQETLQRSNPAEEYNLSYQGSFNSDNDYYVPNAARIRCVDEDALRATIRWYACSKFTPENQAFIDMYDWDEMAPDFDPRVFQAFIWAEM